jgi:hypothetical protein
MNRSTVKPFFRLATSICVVGITPTAGELAPMASVAVILGMLGLFVTLRRQQRCPSLLPSFGEIQ